MFKQITTWFEKIFDIEKNETTKDTITYEILNNDPRDLVVSHIDLLIDRVSNQILAGRAESNEYDLPAILYVYPHQWYRLQEKLGLQTMSLSNTPTLYWWQHHCYLVMTEDPALTEKMKKNDSDE